MWNGHCSNEWLKKDKLANVLAEELTNDQVNYDTSYISLTTISVYYQYDHLIYTV